MKRFIVFFAVAVLFFPAAGLYAQEWSPEQLDVWKSVNQYWELYASGDVEGFLAYMHKDFVGWPPGSNYPQNRESRVKFIKFSAPKTSVLVYTIAPAAIAVPSPKEAARLPRHPRPKPYQADRPHIGQTHGLCDRLIDNL